VHAATDVVKQPTPQELFITCLEGTQRVLNLARKSKSCELLLVSSGAVYGSFPPGMTHVKESYLGGLDPFNANSAYAESKRISEWLVAQEANDGLAVKIARVFAVVGPHLPLDKRFAVGNFLLSALLGEDIVLHGDGTAHRSYLYASDMAAWLWAILLRGQTARAYNVGSEESVSLLDLANRVSRVLTLDEVQVRTLRKPLPNAPPQHYVPATQRAQSELGLPPPISLEYALEHTARWHLNRKVSNAQFDERMIRRW
jgi:dTDP-glucose 4,6-dehydratase